MSGTAVPDLSELDARFARLGEEYERRRTAAHDAVARWEWYSWHAFDPRPLHYERNLDRPGHRLDERPGPTVHHHRIGFDAAGRPVVIEQYSPFVGGKLYYETFRDHGDGQRVEEAHYSGGRPIHLHEYRYAGDRITSAWMVAIAGAGHEEYHYTGDRVTRIVVHHVEKRGKPGRRTLPVRLRQTIDAAYDDHGLVRLESVRHGERPGDDRAFIIYERPPEDFSVEAACATVEDELVARIPEAVAGLTAEEPAYCVAIAYFGGEPGDVLVYVGLESVRQEWLPRELDEGPWYGWYPADISEEGVSPDLSAVADTVRLLGQELKLANSDDVQAGDARFRELLCSVARRLNAADWSGVLRTTDDFIVYACDMELEHFDVTMPASVPEDRLLVLARKGLL